MELEPLRALCEQLCVESTDENLTWFWDRPQSNGVMSDRKFTKILDLNYITTNILMTRFPLFLSTYEGKKEQTIFFFCFSTYHKVRSSRLPRLVAHLRIFSLFMKGKFDAYVLWPLAKRVQIWIVDRSTARDFTVNGFTT